MKCVPDLRDNSERILFPGKIFRQIFSWALFFGNSFMTKKEKEYVEYCLATDPVLFYHWNKWEKKRREILALDKFECQNCKNKYHRYRKANTVHHVNHLKDRPELALSTWYTEPVTHKRRRQLISLCHDCHEEVHGYRCKEGVAKPEFTIERWD